MVCGGGLYLDRYYGQLAWIYGRQSLQTNEFPRSDGVKGRLGLYDTVNYAHNIYPYALTRFECKPE